MDERRSHALLTFLQNFDNHAISSAVSKCRQALKG